MKNKIKLIMMVAFLVAIGVVLWMEIRPNSDLRNPSDSHSGKAPYRYNTIGLKKSYFSYENMVFNDSKLVPFLLNKLNGISPDSLHIDDVTLADMEDFPCVGNDLFSIFASFNIVDSWSKDWVDNYPSASEKISDILQNCSLFNCGQVKISDSFCSFLFMLKSETTSTSFLFADRESESYSRELFLVNLDGDTITSVSSLFSYAKLYGGVECTYTNTSPNNSFCCHFEVLSSDSTCSDRYEKEKDYKVEFSFDKHGRIVLK